MKTLKFSNGDEMPLLGLGTWKSAPGEVYQAVKEAVHAGYRHIDCAAIYQNEEEVGRAVTDLIEDGMVKREDLWITSKLWNNAHRQEEVMPALEKTLADLQLEYLDLYLMHWPVVIRNKVGLGFPRSGNDLISLDKVPLLETWNALIEIKEKGLTRHVGVSNCNVIKLKHFQENSSLAPEMNQVEMHPYLVQQDLVDYAQSEGIHLTAYSPLGSADRPTAKRDNRPVLLENNTVRAIAEKRGVTPAQVLIAFQIHRGIAVIPKSVNAGRIRENFASIDVSLQEEDIQALLGLDEEVRYIDGAIWTIEGSPYTLQSLWKE